MADEGIEFKTNINVGKDISAKVQDLQFVVAHIEGYKYKYNCLEQYNYL